jgi:hypothetical protein
MDITNALKINRRRSLINTILNTGFYFIITAELFLLYNFLKNAAYNLN